MLGLSGILVRIDIRGWLEDHIANRGDGTGCTVRYAWPPLLEFLLSRAKDR